MGLGWCLERNGPLVAQHLDDRWLADTLHHAEAKDPGAPAIILSHGWPWTFWDFRDVIGPLSRPDDFGFNGQQAFNVVVPSLPGFGFSAPLRKAGVDVSKIASIWVELMTEQLGYQKFCAFGGDWGSLVTAHLAHAHPEKLIGAHLGLAVIPGLDRRSLSEMILMKQKNG